MDHHARYGIAAGAALASVALLALIVETIIAQEQAWLRGWALLTAVVFIAAVLDVAACVGLYFVGQMQRHFTARCDELEVRNDELKQRINNQCIEAYSLGLAQGARMRDTGGGIRVN